MSDLSQNPVLSGASRGWLVMAPTALLSLFGIMALIGLFIVGARLDRGASEDARTQMEAAMDRAGSTLAALAKDNAWWDEAFDNVYVKYDADWVERTWGAGGFSSETGEIDGLMVVNQAGLVLGGYGLNLAADQAMANSMRGLRGLLSDAAAGPAGEPKAAIEVLGTEHGIALTAAVAITPYEARADAWDPSIRPVVVVYNLIDQQDFERLMEQAGVTDMRLGQRPGDARDGKLLAHDASGDATWITWKAPMPGTEMVKKLILPVAGLTLLLLGLSVSAGRRILNHEKIVSDYARQLSAAHAMMGTALEAIDEGFGISIEGRVGFRNRELERLIGVGEIRIGDEVAALRAAMLRRFTVIDGDAEAFEEGRQEGCWLLADSNGTVLEIRRLVITGGVMMLVRDVTRDREQQQELIAARRDAEYANHVKSQFLAQMSHELRTPLNAILGFSEVISLGLFGKVEPQIYGGYASNIHESGKLLLSLVNDVLDLSKIEAGRMEANIESVAVDAVVEDARMLMSGRAESKKIALNVAGGTGLVLKADPKMAKQVLINLLSNAVKFTPEGGSVDVTAARTLDGMVEVRVRDTGIGMSQDDLARALQPFGQAKARKNVTDEPGTGLGLPIVVGLCRAQGGSFSIESKPDVGTIAIVRLPAEAVAGEPDATADVSAQAWAEKGWNVEGWGMEGYTAKDPDA